jgi:hypothetical protein
MIAIIEIMLNVRTEDSKPRYDLAAEEPVLQDSEAILRQEHHEWLIRSSSLERRLGDRSPPSRGIKEDLGATPPSCRARRTGEPNTE